MRRPMRIAGCCVGAISILWAGGCRIEPTVTETARGREAPEARIRAELASGSVGEMVLENESIRVAVLPDLGGKIISLRDLRSGREWLWQNPHVRLRPAEPGSAYGDYDMSGWDECFPSVGNAAYPEAPWKDVPYGDHGEVWCLPWDVYTEGGDLVSVVDGRRFAYELTRRISLAGAGTVRLDYRVRIRDDVPFKALWAGHALFAAEPGMRIEFPPGTRMRIRSEEGTLGAPGTVFDWPTAPGRERPVDLSKVPPAEAGWYAKVFTEELPEPWVRLVAPDGATMTMRLDPNLAIGLWLNYGGIGGAGQPAHYNIGIEPTTVPAEHPLEAEARGIDTSIRGEAAWSVVIELRPGD